MGVRKGPFDNGLATAERAVSQPAGFFAVSATRRTGKGCQEDWESSALEVYFKKMNQLSPLEVTRKCRLIDPNFSGESETMSLLYQQLQEKGRGSGIEMGRDSSS